MFLPVSLSHVIALFFLWRFIYLFFCLKVFLFPSRYNDLVKLSFFVSYTSLPMDMTINISRHLVHSSGGWYIHNHYNKSLSSHTWMWGDMNTHNRSLCLQICTKRLFPSTQAHPPLNSCCPYLAMPSLDTHSLRSWVARQHSTAHLCFSAPVSHWASLGRASSGWKTGTVPVPWKMDSSLLCSLWHIPGILSQRRHKTG